MADLERFILRVLTPERQIFSGEVETVTAAGHAGDFGVLPGHCAYITAVRPGALTIDTGSGRKVFASGEGFAQVTAESVSIIVSRCEPAAMIDVAAARQAMHDAEAVLLETGPTDSAYLDAKVEQSLALGRLLAVDALASTSGTRS